IAPTRCLPRSSWIRKRCALRCTTPCSINFFQLPEPVLPRPASASRRPCGGLAFFQTAFNGSALFVVIPGCNQEEGKGIVRGIVVTTQLHSVLKRLSAALRHVAVQAPRSLS